jgi:ABC-type spermidine/putrescine transport system permease subunit I
MAGALGAPRPKRRPWSIGRGYALLMLAPAALLLAFFVTPLATVVEQGFSGEATAFDNFAAILGTPSTLAVVGYTFQVALTVTVAALLLGYPVAYVVSHLRGRWFAIAIACVLLPFWTSTVIRTYAWVVILQRRGILNDLLLAGGLIDRPLRLMNDGIGMQIAMVHIMLPFMVLPLLSSMRSIDGTLLRAAAVLGANPFRQFVNVYLPLSMPGVSAGCVLVFITSLGFYITPALLGGSKTMIAVLIEQQASRLLNWPLASALSTVLLLLTCLLFIAYERLTRRTAAGTEVA